MIKDILKVAGILFGGIAIGAALQGYVDDKGMRSLKRIISDTSKDNIELAAQLETAKVINSQVGVYAVALKRQLDEYTN